MLMIKNSPPVMPTIAHCCERMAQQVHLQCAEHPSQEDCPDSLIAYSPRSGSYGLRIHDGGASSIGIAFCPWCGAKLPT